MKKTITLLCLVLCLLLPVAAQAVQPDRAASLTLRLVDEGEPLPGASFAVYRVAAMNTDARFELLDGFDAGGMDINRMETAAAWAQLADLLAARVGEPTATGTTGQWGEAKLEGLATGLYLVLGQPVEIGSSAYDFAPFLVSVPGKQSDQWQYDVVAEVKFSETGLTRSLRVVKYWYDGGNTLGRPQSILVGLYCDGMLYTTVELTAANSWMHTFTDLPSAHQWTVEELSIPAGYSVAYSTNEDALILTNSAVNMPTTAPDIPQTGLVWWPVPLLAVLGLGFVVAGLVLRQKWGREHE